MRYTCFIENKELTVHKARVSAIPYNTVWPGKQRPLDQTEEAYFVSFDISEKTTLCVDIKGAEIEKYALRPLQFNVPCRQDGNRLVIEIEKPMNFTVEINGYHNALHVFANPKDDFIPDENTLYFGPGEHDAGLIFPKENQTVYIAEGATVYGSIYIYRQNNVTVRGRGILDTSKFKRGDEYKINEEPRSTLKKLGLTDYDTTRASCFTAYGCHNLKVEGVIFRDASCWTFTTRNGCKNVEIDNIKIIGQWRYNTDGVDLCTTYGAVLKNSFIRSFDDCIVVRAPQLDGEKGESGCEDIRIYNNVLWCDWGKNLELWCGKYDAHVKNIEWRDNYLIHTAQYAISIDTWYGSDNITVENVSYENIFIDTDTEPMYPVYQSDLNAPYKPNVTGKNPTSALFLGAMKLGRDTGNQSVDLNADTSAFKIKYKNISFKNVSCTNKNILLPIEIKQNGVTLDGISFENCNLK
ncbi:MAG: hypothetical protein IKB23_05080 [Clostridia bacterium]|nr:hypothetical protein [Clostridia bacterium]